MLEPVSAPFPPGPQPASLAKHPSSPSSSIPLSTIEVETPTARAVFIRHNIQRTRRHGSNTMATRLRTPSCRLVQVISKHPEPRDNCLSLQRLSTGLVSRTLFLLRNSINRSYTPGNDIRPLRDSSSSSPKIRTMQDPLLIPRPKPRYGHASGVWSRRPINWWRPSKS